MTINLNRIASDIAEQYTHACEAYDNNRAIDRARTARSAKDGQTVKFGNQFEDKALQEDTILSISVARGEAKRILADAKRRIELAITDAPTTDEANYITAISGRDDMSEAEVTAALNRYHSHAAQHAIVAAAKRSGLRGYHRTEVEAANDALDQMENAIENDFTLMSIGNSSEGRRTVTRNNFTAIATGAVNGSVEAQFAALFGN